MRTSVEKRCMSKIDDFRCGSYGESELEASSGGGLGVPSIYNPWSLLLASRCRTSPGLRRISSREGQNY